jgi:hypothetical protein
MAGAVRQPIDVANLQRFLKDNVPEIALPISIKQVDNTSMAINAAIAMQ